MSTDDLPDGVSPTGGRREPPEDGTDRGNLAAIFDAQADTPTPRRWLRRLVGIGAALLLTYGLAWGTTALVEVVGPPTLVKLLLTDPSDQGGLFPSRTVAAAATPRPFPNDLTGNDLTALTPRVPWGGSRLRVEEMLTRTSTRAFLVIRRGRVVAQWYAPGTTADTTMSSWSVAKSVVSLLVGQAIAEGKLAENDRLVDVLPEFTGGSGQYDRITVRHLLDMTAAIDVSENYNEYWPFTGAARLFISTDLVDYLKAHRATTDPVGSVGDYRSVETQMLALVVAKAQGKSVSQLLAEKIWAPIGAEDDATWNLDTEDGTEKGFCCLNATARDFAKIGQLVLDRGAVNGVQVVPRAWIRRISTPAELPVGDWGYSAQWWHVPPGGRSPAAGGKDRPDLTAIGIHGQYVHVDPATRTVFVKLSDHGTEQDEQLTVDAMRAIAAGLA